MQFDAAVLRPGQAPTAEDADLEAKVAAVLLRHYVRGDLGSAEQRVQAVVDATALVDAVPVFRARVFPACLQLSERDLVGRVAVDFVRASEREDRVGLVAAQPFQHVHCSGGVDVEILERHACREVVRRLRRAVDDQIETLLFEQSEDGVSIPDVELDVFEVPDGRLQTALIPACVPVRTEEDRAHVVVDTDDLGADPVEIGDGFGTDETI